MPAADFTEANEEHQAATGNHDGSLDRVGVCHRGEAAHDGDDGNGGSHQPHHRHDVPSEQTVENESSGVQMEGKFGHDADDEHEAGKEDAGRPVIAELQKFRNGIDLGPNVIRKQECAGDSKADACREFDRARGEAVSISISGKTDQVLCADIGGEERRADQWPAEPPPGQEELRTALSGTFADCDGETSGNARGHGKTADDEVKWSKS
jgi:hypothetical protein